MLKRTRLGTTEKDYIDLFPGLEKLVVGAEYIKLMWVPDTFFVNEKTAYFHEATTENQFLRILHTGEILRSIR